MYDIGADAVKRETTKMVKEYWKTYNEIASSMEKISVSDLSVGDWVQARMIKWNYEDLGITPPMRVAEISGDEDEVMLQLGNVTHYALVDDLQPIPITAEILEKNGLDYAEFGLVVKPKFNKLCASVGASIEIEYVHELQHVLRLVRTNKEIITT